LTLLLKYFGCFVYEKTKATKIHFFSEQVLLIGANSKFEISITRDVEKKSKILPSGVYDYVLYVELNFFRVFSSVLLAYYRLPLALNFSSLSRAE